MIKEILQIVWGILTLTTITCIPTALIFAALTGMLWPSVQIAFMIAAVNLLWTLLVGVALGIDVRKVFIHDSTNPSSSN